MVSVGADDAVRAAAEELSRPGAPAEVCDLGGRLVIPGLIDAHVHFSEYAIGLQSVAAETATLDECLARVAARAAATPKGEWITGQGWNQNPWGRYPTAADLDRVAADHPVFLESKSWHAGWVNSLALRLAGIDETTPDPPGGADPARRRRPAHRHPARGRRHGAGAAGHAGALDRGAGGAPAARPSKAAGAWASPVCTTSTASAPGRGCRRCRTRMARACAS